MVVCGDRPPDHARGAGGPGPGGVQPPGQHAAQQQTGAGAGEVLCTLGVTTDHTAGRVSRALHQPGGLQSAGGHAAAGGGLQGAADRLLQAA